MTAMRRQKACWSLFGFLDRLSVSVLFAVLIAQHGFGLMMRVTGGLNMVEAEHKPDEAREIHAKPE